MLAAAEAWGGVAYRVVKQVPLDLRTEPPTFVCLSHLALLDRGRLVYIGRPLEQHSTFTVLDLESLEIRNLTVPGIPGMQVPPKGQLAVDKPLFYDTANGVAGILLRGGGLVSGDAVYMEWDLRANRESRRIELAPGAGAPWTSVEAIGYDPERRECYVEIIREVPDEQGARGQLPFHQVAVVGITDRVRTIATIRTKNRYSSKSPYFDPVHRRSAHVEYVELGGEQARTGAHIVDLDSGAVTELSLPRVIYGFAFDPDGTAAYAYSNTTGEVLKVNLGTGVVVRRSGLGRFGHVLDFVAPDTLVLMRNARLHFLDSATLKEKWGLNCSAFHQGSPHTEGSIVIPGRILARIYYTLYVIDFPGLVETE